MLASSQSRALTWWRWSASSRAIRTLTSRSARTSYPRLVAQFVHDVVGHGRAAGAEGPESKEAARRFGLACRRGRRHRGAQARSGEFRDHFARRPAVPPGQFLRGLEDLGID